MPTVGRKPLEFPKKELRIFVSTRLYNEIQILLLNPMTGKPKYGALSKVGEALFRNWILDTETNPEMLNFIMEE